jgi:hypothetical protein
MGGMGCQTCYDTPCTCPEPFDDEEMLRVGNTLPNDVARLFGYGQGRAREADRDMRSHPQDPRQLVSGRRHLRNSAHVGQQGMALRAWSAHRR